MSIIRNNLVWKFNGQEKYPVSLYRDEYSSVIGDSEKCFIFGDQFMESDSDESNKILNATQHMKQYNRVTGTYAVSRAKAGRHTEDEEDIPIPMTFRANLREGKQLNVHIYGFRSVDNKLNSITLRDEAFSLTEPLSIFGNALELRLMQDLNKAITTIIEEEEERREQNRGVFSKLFGSKDKSPVEINKYWLLEAIDLAELVPDLVNLYIYEKIPKEEQKQFMNDLTIVISVEITN